jgi:hypothetical protein
MARRLSSKIRAIVRSHVRVRSAGPREAPHGIAFMFVEISLIQRMSLFLGHPVYGLAIVLFSIILATVSAV